MSLLQSSRFILSRAALASSKRMFFVKAPTIPLQSISACGRVQVLQKRKHSDTSTTTDTSSLSPGSSEDAKDIAMEFIQSLGHSERIAKGVVNALATSGLTGTALLSTIKTLSGRIEVGEDGGLEDLIHSVEQELARTDGKKKVSFYCVPPSGEQKYRVQAFEGMTLTDVARFGGVADEKKHKNHNNALMSEFIECACSGIMACSTCHVVIDPAWYDKVGKPSDAEQDMIDLAYQPSRTSRLGCQIVLTPELDGLVIKIPSGANNMMDYIPFED